MLAELGCRADAALTRGTDAAHEAVHATVVHLRRIAGSVSVALTRVTRETQDLVWDYQDVAADLRRPSIDGATQPAPRELPPQNGTPALRVVGPND
jgi:hypothetical protein